MVCVQAKIYFKSSLILPPVALALAALAARRLGQSGSPRLQGLQRSPLMRFNPGGREAEAGTSAVGWIGDSVAHDGLATAEVANCMNRL